MPRCIISSNSLLLAERGWINCREAAFAGEFLGIDRHGRIAPQHLTAEVAGSAAGEAFIGTSRSCGIFSKRSVLLDASAATLAAEEIALQGTIADLKFEQALSCPETHLADARTIWDALALEAAVTEKDVLILRCRSATHPSDALEIGRVRSEIAGRSYWRVQYDELEAALPEHAETIMSQLLHVFQSGEDVAQIVRAASPLALTICATLDASGRPYALQYDSIQHTALVHVHLGMAQKSGLGDGRCAHLINGPSVDYSLVWTESSWHPLVNGLVVVGSGR